MMTTDYRHSSHAVLCCQSLGDCDVAPCFIQCRYPHKATPPGLFQTDKESIQNLLQVYHRISHNQLGRLILTIVLTVILSL